MKSLAHRPALGVCMATAKGKKWIVHGGLVTISPGFYRCVTCGSRVRTFDNPEVSGYAWRFKDCG